MILNLVQLQGVDDITYVPNRLRRDWDSKAYNILVYDKYILACTSNRNDQFTRSIFLSETVIHLHA